MKRIALGIEYDGAPWRGWQTQPSRDAIQDVLENALMQFTGEPIRTTCAGRTDAGVHALEQVVHLDTDVERKPVSWVRGLNSYLPRSIAVRWATVVPELEENFHARFSARARTYHYVLHNHPVRSPLLRGRCGWVFRPLDEARMQQAAQMLIGEHDFSCFRAAECQATTPVRDMHQASVMRNGDMLVVTLRANAFLHHMVRNIVGALVVVGNGNRPPQWIGELIESRDRSLSAPTFVADGLYLARVDYDPKWQLPQESHTAFPLFQVQP